MVSPVSSPPIPTAQKKQNKPVHMLMLVGERFHSEHLLGLLRPHLPFATAAINLERMPNDKALMSAFFSRVPDLAALHGSPDHETLVICKNIPPHLPCIEAALEHLHGKAPVMVIETDKDRLLHELHPLRRSRARLLERSLADFTGRVSPLVPKFDDLKRRYPLQFTLVEHRRSVHVQARHINVRLSLLTGHKMPACS